MPARTKGHFHRRKPNDAAPDDRVRRPGLPIWKLLLFALSVTGVFFLVLEGFLALLGVNPVLFEDDPYVGFHSQAPLFVEQREGDETTTMATAGNKLRFFQPQRFLREKPEGASRIFCMGGSTTYGRPYDDITSFCGWLRELLPVADPTRQWELVNAGGVSYASYRVALLMEELVQYEPDLFIIYSGHNEFLERRTYDRIIEMPKAVSGLGGYAGKTRTFALIKNGFHSVGSFGEDSGMRDGVLPGEVETLLEKSIGPSDYHRDDILRKQVLDHYRYNLSRMVDIARSAGAKVILVTPASNLRDSAPFKSEHRTGIEDAEIERFQQLFTRARQAYDNGEWQEALDASEGATQIDDRFAHLHYLRGQLLWEQGRYDEAGQAFIRARDEDVCPLRALSPMLDIVKDTAKERGVALVDFQALAEDRSEHGVPGSDSFLDHVHPTIESNRRLALALIDAMAQLGQVRSSENWGEAEIARITEKVEGSLDLQAHGKALRNLSRLLRWAGKTEEAHRLALQSLELVPDDVQALYLAGSSALKLGNPLAAGRHLGTALRLDPKNSKLQLEMGNALQAGGFPDQAITHFKEALRINPDSAITLNNLANAYADLGDFDEAIGFYGQAISRNPDYAEGHNNLGLALARRGENQEAVEAFREAVRIDPEMADAYNNLGSTLLNLGNRDEAVGQFRRAVDLDPAFFEAHLNLGMAYSSSDEHEKAVYHLQKAVNLGPRSGEAHYGLAMELVRQGDPDKGVEHLERAVNFMPGSFDLHFDLATVLAGEGREVEAIRHYKKALKINAKSAETHFCLAQLEAGRRNFEAALAHGRNAMALAPDWIVPLVFTSSLLAAGPDPTLRDTGKAVELAERGAALSGHHDPRVLNTLAFAYASANRFQEAVETAETALELVSVAKETNLAQHLREQIVRYRRGEL